MTNKGPSGEFAEIERDLRANRADISEVELDRIKRSAIAGASHSSRRAGGARKLVSIIAATAITLGGTGAVLAASGGSGGGGGDAGKKQYCPPTSQKPGLPKPPFGSCGKGRGGHGH